MRHVSKLAAMLGVVYCCTALGAEPLGLRVPEGFAVTQFAGDELATNIHSLTIDSLGRVVVAGPGYIKILHDDDGDGQADRFTLFAPGPKSGAHSLCFVGRDLLCTGDNAVRWLRDADGNDQADDPEGEIWARLGHSEHGANGVVQGPDGWFYMVCGNNAGVTTEHVQLPGSPVTEPKCGAILRFAPDGRYTDVVAHGFRNPYDLDFDSRGRLFTVDSDNERDHALPWYAPTRLFDIAQGMEHGWLLDGWQRSWNRPESFIDNVERLVEFGRGSPTGLIVYRHRQFPRRYRDGVFSCCWTLGRIYHVALEPSGSTYRGKMSVFLEAEGDVGFAPVDMAVSPEGDLYVAVGGRGTRGSVYRVRYEPAGPLEPRKGRLLDRVLRADQPLASWSRAQWLPLAEKLGPQPFEGVAIDAEATAAEQIRAIEVLVECFGGVSEEVAIEALALERPDVSARIAWALGRAPDRGYTPRLLSELTEDAHPAVQRAAWEALATTIRQFKRPTKGANWSAALESPDRRVRVAMLQALAARLETNAGALDEPWFPDAARLERLLVERSRSGDRAPFYAGFLEVLKQSPQVPRRLEAVRRISQWLGDYRTDAGRAEVFSGYTVQIPPELEFSEADRSELAAALGREFPASDAELNRELARLLGALGVGSDDVLTKLAAQLTATSPPLDDIHYLIVLASLAGHRNAAVTGHTAEALVDLAEKLDRAGLAPDRFWPERIGEMFDALCAADAELPAALAAHPRFGRPEHCLFAQRLSGQPRETAARVILDRLTASEDDTLWTIEAVRLFAVLPAAESLPMLRTLWDHFALRDAIVPILARHRQAEDWPLLVEVLDSPQADVVKTAANALRHMPQTPDDAHWAAAFRALRHFCAAKEQRSERKAILGLIEHWAGSPFEIDESADGALLAAYQPCFDWLAEQHPAAARLLASSPGTDLAAWAERLEQVDWSAGDAGRGRLVYEKRSCARCHTGSGRLGPDLAGAAARFSRADLFTAIVDPGKDVAPLYRTTMIVTRQGQVHHGLIVYESTESTLLQTGPDQTVRVRGSDVELRLPSRMSLMPTGLLNDATDQDLADLDAYLRTLRK